MGEDTKLRTLPLEHVRIEGTLDWYFNYADADLGLQSNHGATVAFLNNPCEHAVATSDAAEERMFRAVESVGRFRKVSAIVNRLSKRDQRDLKECYTARRWPNELTCRPTPQRWFAASSPVVRDYLRSHGSADWTLEAAESILAASHRGSTVPDAGELQTLCVDAWSFAERAVDGLLRRYREAERASEIEAEATRTARRARLGTRKPGGGASPRRLS